MFFPSSIDNFDSRESLRVTWEESKSSERARRESELNNVNKKKKKTPKKFVGGGEMKMFCERIMLIFSFFMRFTDAGWLSRVVFHREMWKICLLMGQLKQCCGFRAFWTRLVVNIWVELWIILSCSCFSLLQSFVSMPQYLPTNSYIFHLSIHR